MFKSTTVKVFVGLAALSLLVFIVLQQSLTFHRMAMFLQDPSKKPSRVRNRIKLQNAKLQGQPTASLKNLPDGNGAFTQSGLDSTITTSHTKKKSVQHMPPNPSNVASKGNKILEKPTSPGVRNRPEQQTSKTSPERRPRLPKALIIGFSKCGTAALRTFLTIHPDVVSPILELRYFTLYYSKGPEWYRKQMPLSTEQQLTIEKTPSYIMTNESLRRIHDFDPKVKLIVIVRDPIVRLQSQYAHVFSHSDVTTSFKKWWSAKPDDKSVYHFCDYAKYIRQVYKLFPREQVLVLSEDDMERNPLPVLKEAEAFLELRPAYSNDMFVFDKSKGFYCFNTHSELFPRVLRLVKVNRTTGCLGGDKGREHPPIGKDFLEHLKEVIRPLNEDLFKLIGKRFQWDNFRT